MGQQKVNKAKKKISVLAGEINSKMDDKEYVEGVLNKNREEYVKVSSKIKDVKLLWEMVSDFVNKRYRDVDTLSIATAVAALVYVASPIDFIPDFIPVIGYLDDMTIVVAAVGLLGVELDKYRKWKANPIQQTPKAPPLSPLSSPSSSSSSSSISKDPYES